MHFDSEFDMALWMIRFHESKQIQQSLRHCEKETFAVGPVDPWCTRCTKAYKCRKSS